MRAGCGEHRRNLHLCRDARGCRFREGDTVSHFHIKQRPAPPAPPKRGVWIDHETGLIHGLPNGPEPLVGPTSGKDYEDLKVKEKQAAVAERLMMRYRL